MYYEKIVHVESVKKALENYPDAHTPSNQSRDKDNSSEFINNANISCILSYITHDNIMVIYFLILKYIWQK
jgi:hypothetical protein